MEELWDVFNDFWTHDGLEDGYLSDADPEDQPQPPLAIEDGEVDEPDDESVDGHVSDVPTTQPEQTQDEEIIFDPYADRVLSEIEGFHFGDTPEALGGEKAPETPEPIVFGPHIVQMEPDSQPPVDSPDFPATQPSPDFADASGGPGMGKEMPPPPALTPAQMGLKRKRMEEIQYP